MNAITSGTPRKTGKVKFFETLGWTLRRFKATRKRLIEMGETSTVRWDTPKTPMQCRPIDLAQWLLFGVWRTIDHEPARQIRSGQAVRP
jgi:hypothetical protein